MRDTAVADAPGRVNLIGEHTDYHEGYVLPMAIPLRTRVRLERCAGVLVRVRSTAIGGDAAAYELGHEARGRGWVDYVQGVTAVLARAGAPIGGFDARIESTIPAGSGLSSSAALTVSLLRALRDLFGLTLDDVALARAAQRVETDFVGAPVGIMDPMASSLGRDGEALLIDTRTLRVDRIPIGAAIEFLVIDSAVPHRHAGGMYAARRRESFEAAAALGVRCLRDVSVGDLPRIDLLPDPLGRRARHVVTENARVLEAADALRAGDAPRLGALFDASHRSMRDDYETSTPEIDLLVAVAASHRDVYGARLTGGGFGGAVVAAVRGGRARAAGDEIVVEYRARTGRAATVLVPAPST
jgi:galactokinase